MATNYYAPGGETFAQVAIGINITNDYLLPAQTIASGSNIAVSVPFGKSATRYIVDCSGGATASIQTTNDTVTSTATADAATWVEIAALGANANGTAIIESPVGGIRVVVATAGSALVSFLTQTQGRNNLG